MEQNAQAFNQITANLSTYKVNSSMVICFSFFFINTGAADDFMPSTSKENATMFNK